MQIAGNQHRPIIVISAPSGTGKNTLINLAMQKIPELSHCISSTTRAPREGEVNGVHYYFHSKAEFEEMIKQGSFLEYAPVLDRYYGTEKQEIERIFSEKKVPILDIDVQGAEILREKNLNLYTIFIAPPSLEELQRRLANRETESEEQISQRLELARHEMREQNRFDRVIINDDLETAATELINVIRDII